MSGLDADLLRFVSSVGLLLTLGCFSRIVGLNLGSEVSLNWPNLFLWWISLSLMPPSLAAGSLLSWICIKARFSLAFSLSL